MYMYTADLAVLAQKHNVTVHAFTDDTQMYLHCSRLGRCIADVSQSMSANRIKLNTDRLTCCGSDRGTVCLNVALFLCCNSVLTQSQHLTTSVCFEQQFCRISTSIDMFVVSASCFYWLRQLRRTRRSLDQESAATLVHAFATSRVDYRNTLLAGAPKVTTDKLQRVLNAATMSLLVPTSSTGVCRGCCTPSCTGSTYLSKSHTS